MAKGNNEVTGIGTGSNTHQMTHMMATAAVIAKAKLSAVDVVSINKKYISSAEAGPANSAIFFVFT